jgi:undecaprenyl diphosphate synthase
LKVEPATHLVRDRADLPRHVAIIMDGNGRWATLRGRPRVFGHRNGARAVRKIVRMSRRMDIPNLTLFAMSTENLARPFDEVKTLFTLLRRYMQQEAEEMRTQGIRFRLMGDRSHLPREVEELACEVERATAACADMALTIAVAYGGKEDLLTGVARLARDGAPVTAENLERHLWSAHLPPVDLLIRTGGERRISNFLLWHLAYAELYFTDVKWPDFDEAHFDRALQDYCFRHRRFGQVADETKS